MFFIINSIHLLFINIGFAGSPGLGLREYKFPNTLAVNNDVWFKSKWYHSVQYFGSANSQNNSINFLYWSILL